MGDRVLIADSFFLFFFFLRFRAEIRISANALDCPKSFLFFFFFFFENEGLTSTLQFTIYRLNPRDVQTTSSSGKEIGESPIFFRETIYLYLLLTLQSSTCNANLKIHSSIDVSTILNISKEERLASFSKQMARFVAKYSACYDIKTVRK